MQNGTIMKGSRKKGCFCYFLSSNGAHFPKGRCDKVKARLLTTMIMSTMFSGMAMNPLCMASQKPGIQDSPNIILMRIDKACQKQAVNARIDPVWQLIPALNGVRLNQKDSMIGWNHKSLELTPLAFDQIPPSIGTEKFSDSPIYRGNPEKRQIALMFNVAWGEEYLNSILATLKKYNVKATFFIDGKWASTHQSLVKTILNSGMELGNHGYQHHLFSGLAKVQMAADISKTNAILHSAAGVIPTLFAPPAGDFNLLTVKVAASFGMKTILWTVDTVDWKRPQPEVIAMRVLMKKSTGSLVLMHPTLPTSQALPSIITNLQKEGYHLVTVSDLISPVRPVPKNIKEALASLRSPQ